MSRPRPDAEVPAHSRPSLLTVAACAGAALGAAWLGLAGHLRLDTNGGLLAVALASLALGLSPWVSAAAARRRRTGAATGTATVQFEGARGRSLSERNRRRVNAVVFCAFAGWAASLVANGQPVWGAVAAVVWIELGVALIRLADLTGRVVTDPELAARVGPMLAHLCERAQCPLPRVTLRDDAVRAAAVRGRGVAATVVLSRPFAQRVDDARLRALLAHEVVHIARRDTAAALTRARVAAFGAALILIASVAVAHDGLTDIPIWLAAYMVGLLLVLLVLSPLNRWRETRADAEGAALAGAPSALADALTVAHQVSQEVRAALYGRPPLRWFLAPVSWTFPTHPPIASRIAALRAMASDGGHATP